jgi:hypothetical protein
MQRLIVHEEVEEAVDLPGLTPRVARTVDTRTTVVLTRCYNK